MFIAWQFSHFYRAKKQNNKIKYSRHKFGLFNLGFGESHVLSDVFLVIVIGQRENEKHGKVENIASEN